MKRRWGGAGSSLPNLTDFLISTLLQHQPPNHGVDSVSRTRRKVVHKITLFLPDSEKGLAFLQAPRQVAPLSVPTGCSSSWGPA